jgi:hypothetical protein
MFILFHICDLPNLKLKCYLIDCDIWLVPLLLVMLRMQMFCLVYLNVSVSFILHFTQMGRERSVLFSDTLSY